MRVAAIHLTHLSARSLNGVLLETQTRSMKNGCGGKCQAHRQGGGNKGRARDADEIGANKKDGGNHGYHNDVTG